MWKLNKSRIEWELNLWYICVCIYIHIYTYRRRRWHPTPVLLPGKPHGRRSLVGCSPWGHWGSDMTERLHFHFSVSCIGEGNGNPLQWSCLENPRDGGVWWAAVYGVSQSRTWLKWLSSSSIYTHIYMCVCVCVCVYIYIYIWNSSTEKVYESILETQFYHLYDFMMMERFSPGVSMGLWAYRDGLR